MNRRSLRQEDPDRLYTVTGGRSNAGETPFDAVSLIVAESAPASGTQSEHRAILTMCEYPTAVVEIAARLAHPVAVTKILLRDLLDQGLITVRNPAAGETPALPDRETLRQVLLALERL